MMPEDPPKKVIVALDSSSGSKEAITWALDNIIVPEKDRAILLTVRPSLAQSSSQAGFHLQETEVRDQASERRREGAAVLQPYMDLCLSRKVACEMRVMFGDARLAVCQAANDSGADALVVGSRGLGTLKRLVLGSVSEYCVHNCSCPVVVVRPKTVGVEESAVPID